jgi:membrane protein YdbS with pleckstrin-like domain
MEWKPRPSHGGWVGLALVGGLLLIDILIVGAVAGTSVPLLRFLSVFLVMLSLPVLGLIAYWTYGFFTLRYHLDRNGLIIRCGGDRQIVPIGRIQTISRADIGPVRASLPAPGRRCSAARPPLRPACW